MSKLHLQPALSIQEIESIKGFNKFIKKTKVTIANGALTITSPDSTAEEIDENLVAIGFPTLNELKSQIPGSVETGALGEKYSIKFTLK
jgi:hypothetical protein